jgi:hypothetical protein
MSDQKSEKLSELWKRITNFLVSAEKALPSFLKKGPIHENYKEYLGQDEFALALDMLEALATNSRVDVGIDFWNGLINAAREMKLQDKVKFYKKKLHQSSRTH